MLGPAADLSDAAACGRARTHRGKRTDRKQYVKDLRVMPKLERMGWIVIRVIKEDNENDIIERTRTARVVPEAGLRDCSYLGIVRVERAITTGSAIRQLRRGLFGAADGVLRHRRRKPCGKGRFATRALHRKAGTDDGCLGVAMGVAVAHQSRPHGCVCDFL